MVDLHDKARSLPEKPGVYIMMNKKGEVIYVGKAKKLINRVSSYFTENPNHNYKTAVMVSHVHDFDYIVTDTEFEALVLENSLIKRHLPRYNILLKDDKGYPFIRLDVNAAYPRFSIVGKPADDGARYFGPFSGRAYAKNAIDALSLALKLPTCKRKFPQSIGKERPCLNAHLNRCDGVCDGRVSHEEYRAKINRAIDLFDGKCDEILAELNEKMSRHAENMEFEAAAKIRDEIRALEKLGVRQKVISGIMATGDVIAIAIGESKCAFSVLHYIDGALIESECDLVTTPVYSDESELLSNFIKQYYMPRSTHPKKIYVSAEIEDGELLGRWLTSISGYKVEIITPKRGEKLKLIQMAKSNAEEKLRLAVSEDEVKERVLSDLSHLLGLTDTPHRIESYDISNTAGDDQVASMVVFEDAKSKRSEYRKFKIKTLTDQDDVAAMCEVIARRMQHYLDGDAKFSPLPDLILLDGGINQTKGVAKLLSAMGISVPVFGMVKDDRHRTRAIVAENGAEIGISSNPAVFSLCGTIQEEVHRVAISYHRSLRDKTGSTLTKIPGVGDKRAKALLRHFKSMGAIKEASLEALKNVLPESTAEAVYQFYREDKK